MAEAQTTTSIKFLVANIYALVISASVVNQCRYEIGDVEIPPFNFPRKLIIRPKNTETANGINSFVSRGQSESDLFLTTLPMGKSP